MTVDQAMNPPGISTAKHMIATHDWRKALHLSDRVAARIAGKYCSDVFSPTDANTHHNRVEVEATHAEWFRGEHMSGRRIKAVPLRPILRPPVTPSRFRTRPRFAPEMRRACVRSAFGPVPLTLVWADAGTMTDSHAPLSE